MSDPNHSTSAPENETAIARTPRRRWFPIAAIALAAALVGAVASQAFSQGGPPWGSGGVMHGPMYMMGPPPDAATAAERADRMVRHLAIDIDATAEQQDKLRAIAKAAAADLFPLREKMQADRERARSLLTQPTIDRAAIEAFRADQMAVADQASRRIAKAIGDAAEVLTPEQRRKLDERLERRRSHWHGWRRG
jgi:Spy/CpxP family protein refolding chaperone